MADTRREIKLAQAEFLVKLLQEVSNNNNESSTILSPISVAIALAMVYAGAKDETAQEINKLLANGVIERYVHEFFGKLLFSFRRGQKDFTLEVANKVYVKSGFSILDSFKADIDKHYGGLFESVNFEESVATAKKINAFVEQATHNKIHELIRPDHLNELTRMVLVNAIYFKGNWVKKFDPKSTQKKTFHVRECEEKQLEMMHKRANFIYQDTKDYKVLGLPYEGGQLFMFFLLPKERYELDQLLAKLTGKELFDMVKLHDTVDVHVILPKFKLSSTHHHLEKPLSILGIARAFSSAAQFGGIINEEEEKLYIDRVIQKAFIEVNEEGTQVAAATAILGEIKICGDPFAVRTSSTPIFRADHPFAFVLFASASRNQRDGIFLFGGLYRG